MSCLRYHLLFNFENIHPSGNLKGKNILLNRFSGTENDNSDFDVVIVRADYPLNLKNSKEKLFFRSFLSGLVSPLSIYGALLFCYVANDNSEKETNTG